MSTYSDASSDFDYENNRRKAWLQSTFTDNESTRTIDSEESYESLFKRSELLEQFTHLAFDFNWMFIAAFANIVLFVIFTYKVAFNDALFSNLGVKGIVFFCDSILLLDITASVVHTAWKRYAALRDLPPRHKVLIVVDVMSVIVMFLGFIPPLGKLIQVQVTEIGFIVFRLYRIVLYLVISANTSGTSTLFTILANHGMVLFLVTHTFACIMKHMACYKCTDGTSDWSTTINDQVFNDDKSPIQWYFVSMFLILGSATSLGAGDIHPVDGREHIIMTIVMIMGFFILDGAFVGAWTSVQMESYRKKSNFSNRLELIEKALNHPNVPKNLKSKILNYYRTFWNQNKGVRYSLFFYELPKTFKQQVYLDMFWNVFEQTYLLTNIHPAFKRAIASVMTTEIFTAGEYVYTEGTNKDRMVYLFKGTLQILSAEDSESPILTLGIGTCLGEANLFISAPSPVNVKAITYCILQCLKKEDFWRVAFKYRKLKQIQNIRQLMATKIEKARDSHELRKLLLTYKRITDDNVLPLRLVKSTLKPERFVASNIIMRKTEATEVECYEPTSLYMLSLHHTTLKYSDETCLRTSFPWILQPESTLLRIWEYLAGFCILFVLITYPYYISFVRKFSPALILVIILINGIYIFDVILQIFTAIVLDRRIVTKMNELIVMRFRKFSFLCDLASVIPLGPILNFYSTSLSSRTLNLLPLNRVLKVYRLLCFVTKITSSFDVNIALIRCIKYIISFLMLAYFTGSALYMVACFTETCSAEGWFVQIQKEDSEVDGNRYQHPFALSLYFGALIISLTSYGNITPWNMMEVGFAMLYSLMGVLVFCYLVSDFSATLMLQERPRLTFIEVVTVIRKYLSSNNMLMNNQIRTYEYLTLQWRINMGYYIRKGQTIFFDIPIHLYRQQQSAKHIFTLSKIPLFEGLDQKLMDDIAMQCVQIFLPPNEIVIYAGETVRELYFIDRGYCEVISAASGKTENILGPSSYFCDFDMILQQPGIYNIRTVTHARILKVPYIHIRRALALANWEKPLVDLAKITRSSLTIQRLFLRSGTVSYHYMKSEDKASWFIFPRRKLHPLSIDYDSGFHHVGIWRFFKTFLLRRTILPNGDFIVNWEIIQTVRIFIMGIYYISLPFYGAYSIAAQYIWIFFDILGLIDIYVRMHVCYYDKRGILVKHPRYTASYYFTTSFTIDFLSLFPFPLFIKLVTAVKSSAAQTNISAVESISRLHKLLQLYRVPGLFEYYEINLQTRGIKMQVRMVSFGHDPYRFNAENVNSSKNKNFYLLRTLIILKFFPISMILFNACASVLIFITCNLSLDKNGYYKIEPRAGSWLPIAEKTLNYDVKEPINAYITANYFIAIVGLSAGNTSFKAQQISEFLFIILVIVLGYLLFTYIVISLITHKASIDMNLTLYQEHMRHLIAFMQKEKITRKLQKRVINHFEHIWQKTHGMNSSNILNKCHLALHEDSVLYLYEDTLLKVPIFEDMGKSFYRLLGLHLEEMYFLNQSTIIKLNDIISTIYIIHKGEVKVLGPDGSTFASLTRGCMFGNIDQVMHSRCMVTVVATTSVDLLCIPTDKFYNLASDYPVLLNKFKTSVFMENASFLQIKNRKEDIQTQFKDQEKITHSKLYQEFRNILISLRSPMILSSFVSCILVTYHLAFQDHSSWIFIISYVLDVIHLMKLFAGFHVPYYNSLGELILDRAKIRKRYLTPMLFYKELLSVFPFEFLVVFVTKKRTLYALTWFRINRILRMWNVYHYFNVTFDRLNVNVVGVKLGSISIFFVLLLHFGACLLYMFACPMGECLKTSWIYYDEKILSNNHYLTSLYFITCIICHNGFGHVAPRTIYEVILCIAMLMVAKFVLSVLMGEISAIVQYFSCTLLRYDYQKTTLKDFMDNSYVAESLMKRIINYVEKLWTTNRGLQVPQLLKEAPSYLLEELKREAYGIHLLQNFLFISCHQDFLRLLIAKLNVQWFFKGDIICQQGDINDTMYFIHKGFVNVYIIVDKEEIITDSLLELEYFGLVQGLFAFTPHTHTYRSGSSCVILTLNLMDWVYLLQYYKAARSEIYEKLTNMKKCR